MDPLASDRFCVPTHGQNDQEITVAHFINAGIVPISRFVAAGVYGELQSFPNNASIKEKLLNASLLGRNFSG